MAEATLNGNPMLDMNTTPLIDVMLVLLIMFITTIPPQSHSVDLDLPQGTPPIVDRVKNKLVITEQNQLLWNGEAVDKPRLMFALSTMQRMAETPELQLQPEPAARYDIVDEVLVMTKRAGISRMGFVGNERYASF